MLTVDPTPIGGLVINRVSMASQLSVALREKILSGEFKPGATLQESTLSLSAGVSRNTMREALQILVRDGLVRHSVHHGFTVTRLSDEDIDEIYRVRRTLEIAGVEAASKAGPEEIHALELCAEEIHRALGAKDWSRIVESDMLFHRRLVAFLGSERIDRFFESLLSELRLALMLADRTKFHAADFAEQHRQLIEPLRAAQIPECVSLLLQHLAESEEAIHSIAAATST
jgi:DNA-binding GntR family transcriptional regulator